LKKVTTKCKKKEKKFKEKIQKKEKQNNSKTNSAKKKSKNSSNTNSEKKKLKTYFAIEKCQNMCYGRSLNF
jgi:hypothetical protein